ncbi:MAG: exopolysaccharide biosynthesis polyprenyl glycosylphosphotransferase [Candidatus Riflebacteria bacterium]|nr:exopolysaccharide biosynthesis polyprenyl glycosylphosphotransferase [Candidatus Riflebacteria bacterium]
MPPVNYSILLPLLSDMLGMILSGTIVYQLRVSSFFIVDPYIENPRQYLLLLTTALLLWNLLLAVGGALRPKLLIFRIDELLLHFKTSIGLMALLMCASFLYKEYDFSRLILSLSWLLFVFLGGIGRQLTSRFRERLHEKGFDRTKAIIIGFGERKELFSRRIRENLSLGIDLTDCIDENSLSRLLESERFDDLFYFGDAVSYEQIWRFREISENPSIRIHLVPSFGNIYLRNLSGGFFDGMVMIDIDSPLSRRLTIVGKRMIDIVVSFVFLLLFFPLFILISVLVKVDSTGPIFFRQIRIGKDGKPFTILKFRTMFINSEAYAPTPVDRRDSRITRAGNLLRSTGLDELPQLWNVLVGEMSLVGPRPEMPFIVNTYTELEKKRLKAQPGITGLWQVYARTSLLPIHSHIEYDLYYIENFSILLDFMILLDTIPTLILRTGI